MLIMVMRLHCRVNAAALSPGSIASNGIEQVASADQMAFSAEGEVLRNCLNMDCFTTVLDHALRQPQRMGLCGRLPTTNQIKGL